MAQKSSILGPQNLESRGAWDPRPSPPDPRLRTVAPITNFRRQIMQENVINIPSCLAISQLYLLAADGFHYRYFLQDTQFV